MTPLPDAAIATIAGQTSREAERAPSTADQRSIDGHVAATNCYETTARLKYSGYAAVALFNGAPEPALLGGLRKQQKHPPQPLEKIACIGNTC